MKDMLERLESLSPEKRVLLTQLLKQQGKQFNVFPVSFAQQRMWVLDQLLEESSAYTISGGVRLSGLLHREALQHALSTIVARHEALRTVFVKLGGLPVQVIQPATALTLLAHDLSHLPAHDQEQAVQRVLAEESGRPFDLARGPLFRPLLLRLSETEHLLLVSIHHIVFDGWSLGVLIRELAQLYEAFVRERPSPLPALALQYADFAQWQRSWLEGTEVQDHLAYWREQLAEPLPVLHLPTDRPRPAVQRFVGAQVPFQVSAAVTERLQALSQQEGATLFMTLLAAFEVLLCRYSGQSDLLIGTPIANRTRAELEGLIGCFINTLVLRSDLSGEPTFREMLRRVKQTALQAYAHQDLPFELLVEEVQPQRDLSRNPLFQVMFVLQNAPLPPLRLTDLTIENLPISTSVAKFDLTLYVWEGPQGLQGHFEYNTDLFDSSTLVRLSAQLQTLLGEVVATPDQTIAKLPLLTASQREQILLSWNAATLAKQSPGCIQDLFDAQVERTPEALAMIVGEQRLTYRELEMRARQVTGVLQHRGVGPEVLVGVCLERPLELVVILLGILKAGGAYVPLDPAYPQERLAFMVEDSQVAMVVSQRHLHSIFAVSEVPVLWLDEMLSENPAELSLFRPSPVVPDNTAYVIYTSGSTGLPKGVVIEHRSTVAMLHWAQECFSQEELAGMLASTSICFDLSVFELFVPLSWGGTVIMAENALQLPALSSRESVTLVNTVPSVISELVREGQLPMSVQTVNLAGEALPRSLVQKLYQLDHIKRVYNLYGPTEDTTYSTWALIENREEAVVPIGRPLPGTQVYVLDTYGQPVPPGVPGELYLAGDGLARGYLNHPELTAERFLPNPFSTKAGSRLYRTGDLVRYRDDGRLLYQGRIDHQVKLRGFRIELGEIEDVLGRHPQVQEVAVVAREDTPGDKHLVAYVVARQAELTAGALRSFLREHVPSHMIPAVFVWLETLPLTPNGKLDRRALPAPPRERTEQQEVYVPAGTPLEEQLVQIWQEILDRETIGIQDNFFDLGGHSLKATQIMSRVQQALGVKVPLRSVFEEPTIAGLARVIEQEKQQSEESDQAPIQSSSRGEKQLEDLLAYVEDLSGQDLQMLLEASLSGTTTETRMEK